MMSDRFLRIPKRALGDGGDADEDTRRVQLDVRLLRIVTGSSDLDTIRVLNLSHLSLGSLGDPRLFSRLPNLATVLLSHNHISDLSNFTQLAPPTPTPSLLAPSFSGITILDLSHNEIADSELIHLRLLQFLRVLNLSNNRLSETTPTSEALLKCHLIHLRVLNLCDNPETLDVAKVYLALKQGCCERLVEYCGLAVKEFEFEHVKTELDLPEVVFDTADFDYECREVEVALAGFRRVVEGQGL